MLDTDERHDLRRRVTGRDLRRRVTGRDRSQSRRRRAVRVSVTGVVVMIALAGCRSDDPPEPPPSPETAPADEPAPSVWPLTGHPIEGTPDIPAALAVKVSNSPEARPQTGLERADVVYEEVVEGGVTRFMAVFHSELPEIVGPVRSARPVDTQILAGLGTPGFAYSGAREEVRELLAATPAASITEGAPGFFRDDGAYASHPVAPHDLFVRAAEAQAATAEGGAQPLADLGWRFEAPPPEGADPQHDGDAIDIAMSSAFRTTWAYDAGAGLYRREQNGADATVTGTGRIGAANVVVLQVRHYMGDSGYPETDVTGEGPAIVLRDGGWYRASWAKPTADRPLQLLTEDGTSPFPLKPGPSWIHLPEQLPGPDSGT